jgi:uncharacterized protein
MSDTSLSSGEGLPAAGDPPADSPPVTANPDSASPKSTESCEPIPVAEFFDETPPAPLKPLRPPGPGLPESLGWTFGVLTAHVAASLLFLVVILGLMARGGQTPSHLADLEELDSQYLILLLGGDQVLVLLVAMVAVWLRFYRRVSSTLNLSAIHPLHILAIVGLMLPLSSLSGELYRLAQLGWEQVVVVWPALQAFDDANTVEFLREASACVPLSVMLLFVAVGPALCEELIFRGVIGRGLVARWGLAAGVLMTSLLFAIVHGHPAHVVAVVPIGVALHLIYLATRSFWAPVLLHFLNNAWASMASQLAVQGTLDESLMEAPLSPMLLVSSLTAIVVLGALLYRTRTRYLLPDGTEWNPGYLTVERPPRELDTIMHNGLCSPQSLVIAGTVWAAFAVAFAAELVAFAR